MTLTIGGLSVSGEGGVVDEMITVECYFENDEQINGYQFGVCHDDDQAILNSLDDVEAQDQDLTFHTLRIEDGGWIAGALAQVTTGWIFNNPGTYQLYDAHYTAIAAGTMDLEFCSDLGVPPVAVAIVYSLDDLYPVAEGLSLEIEDPEFLRGDADGDGAVDGLIDAVWILEWAFLAGAVPPCLDAADANDDGTVTALVDATFLVAWGFSEGEAPPAPGADDCGVDPTIGDLTCLTVPAYT